MTNLTDKFIESWTSLEGKGDAERIYRQIEHRYTTNKLPYHNIQHIIHCMDEHERIKELFRDPHAAALSLFYHDIIYFPGRHDNEQKSAEYAYSTLGKHISQDAAYEVCGGILATAHKKISDIYDYRLIQDIDLSILGATWDTFKKYAFLIRQEYAFLTDERYTKGRIRFLDMMLNRAHIYGTGYFRDTYEVSARTNIEQEIKLLSNSK